MVRHIIPLSLEEAKRYLKEKSFKIIAGGTDLMVQHRSWAETPPQFEENLLYVFNLDELKYINKEDNILHIGSLTPIEEVKDHKDTPYLLEEAIKIMASPALRNAATIAGNIGNASPAGDTLPVLYVYNALVKLENEIVRRVPIEEVIKGPRKTIIQKDEIITEISFELSPFTHMQFVKVGGRKADAISKLSFCGAINISHNLVTDFRIAFGAVGPVVVRNKKIEDKYLGLRVEELKNSIEEIISDYKELITPINDQRSTKEYRKQVSLNLLKEFILSL